MKKIKLLILADLRSAHTKKWAEVLSEFGLEVHLFGLTPPEEEFRGVTIHSGEVKSETAYAGETSLKKFGYFFELNRLNKLILSLKPDIVHSHYATSYGLLGALAGRKPYFISVWGSDVVSFPNKSPLHKKMLKYALSRADLLFSTSEFMAAVTRKYTDKEIIITPFGVDTEKFAPSERQKDESKIRIGMIKTLSTSYGQEHLLRAFAIVKEKLPEFRLELEITGGGSDLSRLKKISGELGIEGFTKFTGYVKQDEIPEVHKNLDIEVYPTVIEETFGVSTVEAMACGIPCIVSKTGGLQYLIEDGESGYHAPIGDHKAIAEILFKLVADKNLRLKIGKGARKRVEEKYDIKQNAKIMTDAYERVLTKKGE
ncbi:glycosyltransferase [Ignavibacteriales bacterium]